MKWLGLVALLGALVGCNSQSATSTSSGSTTGGGISSSGSTGAGTSTGTASGGLTSSGTSSGGSTTGPSCAPACGANASCEDGGCRCVAGASNCPFDDGGQNCVNEKSDEANCGRCGRACPAEASCGKGICECAAGPACETDAGLACVDFSSDNSNCGSCGNICPEALGATCSSGTCQCRDGASLCGSQDAGNQFCINTSQDPFDCGACGNVCATSYAMGSGCHFGLCLCSPGQQHICATVPGSPPACACTSQALACASPSFARDIYPLLAQEKGAFGCSASGCHSGAKPAAGLSFLDETGEMDAGMAYAELLGIDGGSAAGGVPECDTGVPPGAPSTQCACASRVVPGDLNDSYFIDVLATNLPANCGANLLMPIDADGGWVPLGGCSVQLMEQWVSTGAGQ